jgi:hypothetical protein
LLHLRPSSSMMKSRLEHWLFRRSPYQARNERAMMIEGEVEAVHDIPLSPRDFPVA